MAKIPFLTSCFLFIILCLLSLACGSRAPKDYYFEIALMEEWGKYNRKQTGRRPHQAILHPEQDEPLAIAFEIGNAPAGLLGFEPLELSTPQSMNAPRQMMLPRVPISLQQDALRRIFREQNIQTTHWRLKDGRLEDKQNVVQIHFMPRALSDKAVKKEFLMVCAIVHGAQLETNTIDVVRGIAEGEDGTPHITLETDILHYHAYLQGHIDLSGWEHHLRLRKF